MQERNGPAWTAEQMSATIDRGVFTTPPAPFTKDTLVRLTVPAVRAVFPPFPPPGVFAHLPITTNMRIKAGDELLPEVYRVELCRSDGSSSIQLQGLPFAAVGGMTRNGIYREDADTLVLVMSPRPPLEPVPRLATQTVDDLQAILGQLAPRAGGVSLALWDLPAMWDLPARQDLPSLPATSTGNNLPSDTICNNLQSDTICNNLPSDPMEDVQYAPLV